MHVTRHAQERAKKRFCWRRKTLEKMMKRAYICGLQIHELKGALRLFFEHVKNKLKHEIDFRIYGENVFIFDKNTKVLITIYKLNHRWSKYLNVR